MSRDFKGIWIPKNVWLDERLNALDKCILMEIDSLDNEKGCYASNLYLAEFCQCSQTKVSTTISRLKEYGYIQIEEFDGRKRKIRSSLSNFKRQTLKNKKADVKKIKDNNIDNSVVINIIKYLNEMVGTSFHYNTPKTKALIQARFNEGFTEDDFYEVIHKKWKEWKGTEWEKYLRPQTLFGTKFEAYLNQKVGSKNPFAEMLGVEYEQKGSN